VTTNALAQLPDASLIRRFLAGEEQAFRALYARHTPRLRMIVLRLLGERRDEVDDVMQEAWLAGCRGMHRYSGQAQFSTWLTTIGVRAAYRRFSESCHTDVALGDEPAATADSFGSSDAIDIEWAIGRLPDHQRAVVVLHDIEGFTHEEIAEQIGIPIGTSKVTLSRARHALRRLLNAGVSHGR
jgi:RNA polymerase sigma-70 factor, ECF subfamily